MVDAHGAPTHLARIGILLEPQLEDTHAHVLVVVVHVAHFRSDQRTVLPSRTRSIAPSALLHRGEVARAVAPPHVPAVLGGDLHHHAVLPARLVLRLAPPAPPSHQARALVAERRGGGVILLPHRRAVAALDGEHGAVLSHVIDCALQRSRLREILARDRVRELTLRGNERRRQMEREGMSWMKVSEPTEKSGRDADARGKKQSRSTRSATRSAEQARFVS